MFIYPRLSSPDLLLLRLRGLGLGNLLFPYFRAVVYANEHAGSKLVTPPWTQIKLNQLRYIGTPRSRLYFRLFRTNGPVIRGLLQRATLLPRRRVTEQSWIEGGRRHLERDAVLIVEGMDGLFTPLYHKRDTILAHYAELLRERDRRSYQISTEDYIAFHLRLGDFKRERNERDERNVALTHEHVRAIVDLLQKQQLPVKIVTDATDQELAAMGISRDAVYRGSRLLDEFHVLCNARILIASASTFSMWAAFLGSASVVRWADGFWALEGCSTINQHLYSSPSEFPAAFESAVKDEHHT